MQILHLELILRPQLRKLLLKELDHQPIDVLGRHIGYESDGELSGDLVSSRTALLSLLRSERNTGERTLAGMTVFAPGAEKAPSMPCREREGYRMRPIRTLDLSSERATEAPAEASTSYVLLSE